jgi:hypothetical protein
MKIRFFYGLRNAAIIALLALASLSAQAEEWIYTVRPGDTLWDIIDKYSVNLAYVPSLQSLNSVEDPRKIRPGTTLRIPVKWLKQQPAAVAIVSIVGAVTVTRHGSSESKPLDPGDLLVAGDAVATGAAGNAVFRFADGSELMLRQHSRIEFDTLSQYGDTGMVDTRARLQKGSVDVKASKPTGGGNRYEIHTPAASTAVRGTEYRVRVDENLPVTRTEVLEGKVNVAGSGKTVEVAAGFGSVIEAGSAPEKARQLLTAPDLSAIPDVVERVPLKLAWQGLEGAVAYRVQLSSQEDFSVLMEDRLSGQAQVSGLAIPDNGIYFFRVRGIDDTGLEGQDSVQPLTVAAYPQPPLMMTPSPEQVLRQARPDFTWTKPADAVAYRFELSADDQFQSHITSAEYSNKPATTLADPLEPGTYYWRLATRDASGRTGPFSDPGSFTYKPPPPGPQPGEPEIGDDALELHWGAGEPGQKFHLQFSRDAEFNNLLADEILDQALFSTKRPRSGTYYFRIATVDTDGTVGEFSTVQEVRIPFRYFWESAFAGFMVLILLL